MHFFTFLSRPLAEPRSDTDPAAAYVNCWIDQSTREAADVRARQLITEAGWRVDALNEYRVVGDEDYDGDTRGREFYDQARIDGEVLVFHTWPASAEKDPAHNAPG